MTRYSHTFLSLQFLVQSVNEAYKFYMRESTIYVSCLGEKPVSCNAINVVAIPIMTPLAIIVERKNYLS
jgi:hypothetical protein